MAYKLYPAKHADWIREQEWAIGSKLTFAKLDSCIAVIGKVGKRLIGIHLVQQGAERPGNGQEIGLEVFNQNVAEHAFEVLSAYGKLDASLIIGSPDEWRNADNSEYRIMPEAEGRALQAGYLKLMLLLPNLQPSRELKPGAYSVALAADGAFQVTSDHCASATFEAESLRW
ncbi:MAG: hypothetical protein Q7U73_12855 [Rubrivivax sp.]|nr:hypothetical protein [Rubrivivax sp.]